MERGIGSTAAAVTAGEVVLVNPTTGAPIAALADGGSVVASGTVGVDGFTNAAYETVAASQTDQMCGATGAAGDFLAGLLVVPATTSPGEVSVENGATNIVVFTGGASSVSNLVPFYIPIGANSVSGGWEITTGANVSVIAFGNFT